MPLNRYLKEPSDIGADYLAEIRRWCAEDDGVILVAETSAGPCGYACLLTDCKEKGKHAEVPHSYALVADLAVTESLRRQGIGTALLEECERRARLKGRDILRIGVLAQNVGAQAAYRRFGFADLHYQLEKRLT